VVQLTPSASQCSVQFGKGITKAAPGSVQDTYLVVLDIETAGPDPEGRSYFSRATFSDPDGNGWLLGVPAQN
jgi:hypothetical protein